MSLRRLCTYTGNVINAADATCSLCDAIKRLPREANSFFSLRLGLIDGNKYTLREAAEILLGNDDPSKQDMRGLRSRCMQELRATYSDVL